MLGNKIMVDKNGLYIIATPIGNIDDITIRAVNTLRIADYIICEDTRHSRKLLAHHHIKPQKLLSFHEHSSTHRLQEVVGYCHNHIVAYISDAGVPIINDPGYELVMACYHANIYVTSLPGPCAAITALTLSALPPTPFVFVGFFPENDNGKHKLFQQYQGNTVISYESPHRVLATISWLYQHYPDVEMAICREITKLYEQTIRGSVRHIYQHRDDYIWKGEMVLLLKIPQLQFEITAAVIDNGLLSYKPSVLAKILASKSGKKRSDVYELIMQHRSAL
jgi:16S rRNA (cytidine1402-2'-O)-methyltransferase